MVRLNLAATRPPLVDGGDRVVGRGKGRKRLFTVTSTRVLMENSVAAQPWDVLQSYRGLPRIQMLMWTISTESSSHILRECPTVVATWKEANLKSDMEKQKKLVLQFKLILEKTVERQREELKKEKDEHQNEKTKRIKCERTIMEAVRKTEKGKATVLSELEKYQLALKRISEELEKLKHAEGNLPQVSLLKSWLLFFSWMDKLVSFSGTAVPDRGPVTTSSTVHETSQHQPAKASEERRSIVPKTNTETRKTGRKLVRPRIVKAEERQGDVEMTEATSHDVDAQGTQQSACERQASATTELSEDLPVPGETSTDVVASALKKTKGPDSGQEAAAGSNEEVVDVEKEEANTMKENLEQSKEPQVDGTNEVGLQENKNLSEEVLDKPSGNEMVTDEEPKNLAVQESQQLPPDTEGEGRWRTGPEIAVDTEGGTDMHNVVDSAEVGGTDLVSSPLASPSRVEDEALVTAAEGNNSPNTVTDDKNDEGDIGEETIGEGFEKSNDGNEQSAIDIDPTPEAVTAVVVTSGTNESGATSGPPEGEMSPISGSGSESSATSTLVNLQERARERAMLRQTGVVGSSTTLSRGRGRVTIRGRGTRGRGVRGGRAGEAGTQNPGQQ
ncbi:hypothetical protein F3Y22_tig00116925pilonHSYRG00009 [Hibiscus syriacus]|uniref:Detected protein of confused Function n=1 Tax=Hibiscus syriacus TaxID=106335 RepID=A0A6A2XXT5_HIBSY|nr:hypothetical protein F3Y22_tig00116925pilonHSYRG00009 [Hibiscus syriacus]